MSSSSSPPPLHLRQEESSRGWASFPNDPLNIVTEKLDSVLNFLRFRSVCHGWRSTPITSTLKFTPVLLLPFDPKTNTYPLYDPLDSKVYSLPLPEARHKALLGSSHGWLTLIDESGNIYLINPLTRAQILLPPATRELALASGLEADKIPVWGWITRSQKISPVTLYHMRSTFISEVIFSCSPSSGNDCLVLAVLARSNKLAYCRVGDSEWKLHDTELPHPVSSIAYCKEKIFAVSDRGEIARCCIGPPAEAERLEGVAPDAYGYAIVAARDELFLLAHREIVRTSSHFVKHYAIYRSPLGEGSCLKWCQVNDANDMTLFMSYHFNSSTICASFTSGIFKKNVAYISEVVRSTNFSKSSDCHCIQLFGLDYSSLETISCGRPVMQSTREVCWLLPHLS